MINVALVALGGALGASLRYLSGLVIARVIGIGFPWNTVFVNVAGSFLMGILIVWLATRLGNWNELRLFLATGLLGGFTTFSAFSLDFAELIEKDAYLAAGGYVAISVCLSLVSIFFGLWLARSLL